MGHFDDRKDEGDVDEKDAEDQGAALEETDADEGAHEGEDAALLEMDANMNGKLSKDEFFKMHEDAGFIITKEDHDFFDKHFPSIDADADGLLNLEEQQSLEQLREQHYAESDGNAAEADEANDASMNGKLSKDEFFKMHEDAGFIITKEDHDFFDKHFP